MKKEKVLQRARNKGIIIILVLVFGTVFLILSTGLLSFISLQHRISLRKAAWNDSLHIAEAGVNYYRWHLNQYIEAENSDIQDGKDWCCKVGGVEYGQDADQCRNGDFIICGTCDGEACYEHNYYNPQGELTGKFVLEIKAKKICGQILGVYINSTGSTTKYPNLKRKVEAKFASTSIAEYGSIIHEAIWRATEEKTAGKFHTNSGVRMDAVNNSLVTSSKSDKDSEGWLCTSSFGCSSASCPEGCKPEGANCRCDGVCGAGSPKDLWKFPTPPFDFTGITNDLTGIKDLAQTRTEGKGYYPPSGEKGYHIIFNGDGTFDIRTVTEIEGIAPAFDIKEGKWITSYEKIITEETLAVDVKLPQCCGLIYVEDNLWIEGTVKGKITVAASDLITVPPVDPTIFITGDLDYTAFDGSDSLAMIAEGNILITLDCDASSANPDEIVLRGVFVAQNGWVGRRGYWNSAGPENLRIRDKLITYGTIVSFIRGEVTYLKCLTIPDCIFSGFKNWDCYFDEKLSRDPPPLLPYVSKELKLISWEEIQ